jgi:hypothetical protein
MRTALLSDRSPYILLVTDGVFESIRFALMVEASLAGGRDGRG